MTKELVDVAKRNLRHYLSIAVFKCETDRTAALNCLDAIEADDTRQRNEGIEAAAKVADQAEKDWQEQPTRSDDQFGRALEETLAKATAKTCSIIATANRALKELE